MKQKLYKTTIVVYHLPPKEAEASDLCREAETGSSAIITEQTTVQVENMDEVPQEARDFLDLPESEVA